MSRWYEQDLFEYQDGLHLKDTPLWLDAPKPRRLCFVSHAGVAGAQGHEKIICTEGTAELLQALAAVYGRGRQVHRPQVLVTPFKRSFALGQLSLELLPAGYVLGSALLLIKWKRRRILYAAEVNRRGSPLVEALEPRGCDLLVLRCGPLAQRRQALPARGEVERQLLRFVSQVLDAGEIPLLLCPPLGESQDLVQLLRGQGHRLVLHRRIFAATRVCGRRAPGLLGQEGLRRYVGPLDPARREVLLWPLQLRQSPSLNAQRPSRRAVISGMVADPRAAAQLGGDAAFALSAEPDLRGVLQFVRDCQPKAVVLLGHAVDALADDLRGLGLWVRAMGARQQLGLFE